MKTVSRKRDIKTEQQENLNEDTQDYWLGGTIPTTNRFSSLSEEKKRKQINKIQNQSHPQSL